MQFRASIAIRMHVRSHVIRNRLIASCMHQDQPPWPRARAVRDVAPVDMRVSVLCTAVSRAASGQAPAAGRASWRTQPYRVEPWGGGWPLLVTVYSCIGDRVLAAAFNLAIGILAQSTDTERGGQVDCGSIDLRWHRRGAVGLRQGCGMELDACPKRVGRQSILRRAAEEVRGRGVGERAAAPTALEVREA